MQDELPRTRWRTRWWRWCSGTFCVRVNDHRVPSSGSGSKRGQSVFDDRKTINGIEWEINMGSMCYGFMQI